MLQSKLFYNWQSEGRKIKIHFYISTERPII